MLLTSPHRRCLSLRTRTRRPAAGPPLACGPASIVGPDCPQAARLEEASPCSPLLPSPPPRQPHRRGRPSQTRAGLRANRFAPSTPSTMLLPLTSAPPPEKIELGQRCAPARNARASVRFFGFHPLHPLLLRALEGARALCPEAVACRAHAASKARRASLRFPRWGVACRHYSDHNHHLVRGPGPSSRPRA